jgi:GR25 family glycosyltransferase involved in LPS biosynthesis
MPLWMFEIDWFGADLAKIQNPLPLPIDVCTTANPSDYDKRANFCAFVVTNPKNPVRNEAFTTINKYKSVDSAGRLFNNVGEVIFAGLGGGGGEHKKHAFLKNYRFNICYENESSPGYTTEKLLHAKAAGCVPIYWGDPHVCRDFNEKGFINARNYSTNEELVKLIDEIESNSEKWRELVSVPALSGYMRDLVRRTFSEMVRRFLILGGCDHLVAGLPPLLGAKTSEEAEALRLSRSPKVSNDLDTQPLFVTTTTRRFWSYMISWLNSIAAHRMTARVYIGADVSDSNVAIASETYKGVAEFIRLPTQTPAGFDDFWDPKHYGWKLWVYKAVVEDGALQGRLIVYMDAASVLLRWPSEWLAAAKENGVSLLEDPRQKNKYWCHDTFCRILQVTDEEKESQQIIAGISAFVAGDPRAVKLFRDAYVLAENRDVLVGEKWIGFYADGKPKGHRHDQSILSIVSQRQGIHRFPLDKVYGDLSARTTFHSGQCIYVHRGNYKTHIPLLEGIDDAFVINLDRRQDRRAAFLEHHPDLKGHIRRLPAYDGLKLQLAPSLARLFRPNDFFWKKAVMGCALSHLKLWTMLLNEPAEMQAFFIMEDDARLAVGWRNAWNTAYKSLPEDWDCVYLGGVLPPNREGFYQTLERVGPGLARVAPNTVFGQKEPTRYFHFCAYAYVLSRRGAKKILDSIGDHGGYWTSADHMICNPVDKMNLFVLDPMVAGASQDDDPAYKSAQFNNFSRVDAFDSDLWNNDERFSVQEIQANLEKGMPLVVGSALAEVDSPLLPSGQTEVSKAPEAPKAQVAPEAPEVVITMSTIIASPEYKKGPRFLSLDSRNIRFLDLYEANWLQDLFQEIKLEIEQVSATDTLENCDDPILLISRPQWNEQIDWIHRLAATGRKFKVIHLADEYSNDPIDFYSLPNITAILRFYPRPDIMAEATEKVMNLPLGYRWRFTGDRENLLVSSPNLPFRNYMWSFAGTDWQNRSQDMAPLDAVKDRVTRWFSEWNDKNQLKEADYIDLMLDSKFIPCPRGMNVETFRFYEALECGCIPLFLNRVENAEWHKLFQAEIPFINLQEWSDVAATMQYFKENPSQMESYRTVLLSAWMNYKKGLRERVKQWFSKN